MYLILEVIGECGGIKTYSPFFERLELAKTRPYLFCRRFMTDGFLLHECENDQMLSSYSAIILDESHERTVDTDLLLGTYLPIF